MVGKFWSEDGTFAPPVAEGLAFKPPLEIFSRMELIWNAWTTLNKSKTASTIAMIRFMCFFIGSPLAAADQCR